MKNFRDNPDSDYAIGRAGFTREELVRVFGREITQEQYYIIREETEAYQNEGIANIVHDVLDRWEYYQNDYAWWEKQLGVEPKS